MDRRENNAGVDGGRIVIALGAVVLLVALFLDWYGGERGFGEGITAWTAFELIDLLLAVLAVAAIAAALEPMARSSTRLPDTLGGICGPAALLLVVVSIVNPPPVVQGLDIELKVGAWLALAGAAIMCAGALLALNRVSLVVTPRERKTDVHAAETETRPLSQRPNP